MAVSKKGIFTAFYIDEGFFHVMSCPMAQYNADQICSDFLTAVEAVSNLEEGYRRTNGNGLELDNSVVNY